MGTDKQMAEPLPNCEELCKILDACARNGVQSLKWHDFEALFFTPASHIAIQTGPAPTQAEEDLGNTIQAQQQAQTASHEEQELQLREDQVAELQITDPLRFEELLEMGELMPEEGADGGDDR